MLEAGAGIWLVEDDVLLSYDCKVHPHNLDFSEKDLKALALTKQEEGNVCGIQVSYFL